MRTILILLLLCSACGKTANDSGSKKSENKSTQKNFVLSGNLEE